MHCLRRLCLLCFGLGVVAVVAQEAEAQLVRKAVDAATRDFRQTRRDYHLEKPFQYSPDDPWYRGKLYRLHTKHYGLFYNCDGEECKRNSPYICWKVHHEQDFPRPPRLFTQLARDLNKVRWRIGNGGCCPGPLCGSCTGCATCSKGAAIVDTRPVAGGEIAETTPPERPVLLNQFRQSRSRYSTAQRDSGRQQAGLITR